MKLRPIVFLLLLCLICIPLKADKDTFHTARLKDISDRAYEKAVIELLDNARESITISMFAINTGDHENHPINRLIEDLEEALDRGVSVDIFLNTRNIERGGITVSEMLQNEKLKSLREKGARILPVISTYLLHDKMIIVDKRFVVIGSVNWSVSALTKNFESSVLIDSELLAKKRLARMKTIHLYGESLRDPPQISITRIHPIPEQINLPTELITNKRYFPKMLNSHANRAMDLYFLLIAESYRRNSKEFAVSLEKLAGELTLPKKWTATASRRQIIKSLKKLKKRYNLIDVKFQHSRPARVRLIDIEGEAFSINSEFLQPEFLKKHRQSKKLILLIKAYLQSQGKEINDFSTAQLSEMFHISKRTINRGMK